MVDQVGTRNDVLDGVRHGNGQILGEMSSTVLCGQCGIGYAKSV